MAGAALVLGFILISLPIRLLFLALGAPEELPGFMAAVAGVGALAVLGGGLGGTAFGLLGLVVGRFGRIGRYVQFIGGTTVYAGILFGMLGRLAPESKLPEITDPWFWPLVVGLGVIVGVAMARGDDAADQAT